MVAGHQKLMILVYKGGGRGENLVFGKDPPSSELYTLCYSSLFPSLERTLETMLEWHVVTSALLFQTSKDHNAELSSQLELLKCQEVDGTSHSKTSGNSLFGEVNDHRIEVERKYISLKVKYESLERTHSTTKQQLKKMKVRCEGVRV